MKVLKHIAGIFFATFGVMVVVATLELMAKSDSNIPNWASICIFLVLGCGPLYLAFLLLKPVLLAPQKPCPQCKSPEFFPAGLMRKSYNRWMHHLGGWILGSLWGASRDQQVRCAHCDTLYFTQTRTSRVVGVILWIFILLILIGMIVENFS